MKYQELKCPSCSGKMNFSETKDKNKIAICEYCGAIINIIDKTMPTLITKDEKEINQLDKQILDLCHQRKKLLAVKLYKTETGSGFAESKNYVDKLAAENGIVSPEGCFIATVCYGNYNASEVLILRNFRDETLLRTFYGTIFVKLYYKISPFIARKIHKSDKLKSLIRTYILKPIVDKIKK